MRGACVVALLLVATARGQEGEPALARRDDIQVAPRLTLHAGAAVGDTLERTIVQRGVERHERTTIVARAEDGGFVIERTGVVEGAALRLVVDAQGRTRAAFVGAPGARALAPVAIAAEVAPPPEEPEGIEPLTIGERTLRCERRASEQREPVPMRSASWVVTEGPFAGLVVKQESVIQGFVVRLEVVSLDETSQRVGEREVRCVHIVRRGTNDGVASPPTEEWIAREPLPFGETLVRFDNGLGESRITAIGTGGRSVFPGDHPAGSR